MKLSKYQRIEHHSTGLVRIIDGSAGVAHSAHPNVEDNRYNRRKHPDYTPAWGFLYSPEVFASTELDKLAARLCKCGCRDKEVNAG